MWSRRCLREPRRRPTLDLRQFPLGIDDIAKLLPAGFNRFHDEGLDAL